MQRYRAVVTDNFIFEPLLLFFQSHYEYGYTKKEALSTLCELRKHTQMNQVSHTYILIQLVHLCENFFSWETKAST